MTPALQRTPMQGTVLYLYCKREEGYIMKYSLSPREILRAKPKGFSEGSGYISSYFPSHNTDILNYNSIINLPGKSTLEELILRIAPPAGQYGKILYSIWSNTGGLNFNTIMFSNWECTVHSCNALCCTVLPCNALWCTILPCNALYCTFFPAQQCTILPYTVLHFIALYSPAMHFTARHFTVLYYCTQLQQTVWCSTAIYCIVMHCNELYCKLLGGTAIDCTALHCTAVYSTSE